MDISLIVASCSVLGLCFCAFKIASLQDELRRANKNLCENEWALELSNRTVKTVQYLIIKNKNEANAEIELLQADNDALQAKIATRDAYIIEQQEKMGKVKNMVNEQFKFIQVIKSIK